MKTKMKTLLLFAFFALLLCSSCQEEKVEITPPNDSETLVAKSELTSLISATSKRDGSIDNIIDKASCLSVELPVTVKVNGLEIIIDSTDDFKVIETIFNEFENDDDTLDIIFPITIILSNHQDIVIPNQVALESLVEECLGENEEDDDIECIDFQYPIAFSVFNTEFQIIDTVTIEDDKQLFMFIQRIENEGSLLASLNFPVTMVLANGITRTVNNNQELSQIIKDAKNSCDEDDDNDIDDDDFTKESLDSLLVKCPWLVKDIIRNQDSLNNQYRNAVLTFKENNVAILRDPQSTNLAEGTWTTTITPDGAVLDLNISNAPDFTLKWLVYELGPDRIKLYQDDGNKIILNKNCDSTVDFTKENVIGNLRECPWRVQLLSVNGQRNDSIYIATPLIFFDNNLVKMRVEGENIEGNYQVLEINNDIILKVDIENRPDLNLDWRITRFENNLIKFENDNNNMTMTRLCPDQDTDFVNTTLKANSWEVTLYTDISNSQNQAQDYAMLDIKFIETGRIEITNLNSQTTNIGSWLSYRNDGLFLDMQLENVAPVNRLTARWKIIEIESERIELKLFNNQGEIQKNIVLEKRI